MNPIIMQIKIKLGAAEKELKEIYRKLKRLTYEIHELVPACWLEVDEIKAEETKQAADELATETKKYKDLKNTIAEIKRNLGE